MSREDQFIALYTRNRPNKLRPFIDACFQSSSYGSDVNAVILHTHKIPELYGQLNGFLFDESVTLRALFPSEVVPDLLCGLIQNSVNLLYAVGMTRYLSVDYFTIDEFSVKSANLVLGAPEVSLYKTYSLLYEPFLQHPNLFVESEAPQIQEDLQRILSSIQFDLNSMMADSLLFEEDESKPSRSATELDFATIDADDITILFNQYAQQLHRSIEEIFQTFESVSVRGLKYLSGMRAKVLIKYLATLCTQQTKSLISKVDELRIASCMQVTESAREEKRDDSLNQYGSGTLSASSIAKQLSSHDLSTSTARGRILLSCALLILSTAGMICRLFSKLEATCTDHLEQIFSNLFLDSLTLSQAVFITATQDPHLSSSAEIGPTIVSCYLRNDPEMETELKAFLSASIRRTNSIITQSVLSNVAPWISKYKLTAEKYFFDLLISTSDDYLRDFSRETIWNSDKTVSEFESEDYARLPQQVLTQVGDHLLSLLQELESFATKSNLHNLLQLKGDAENLALASWKSMQSILEIKEVFLKVTGSPLISFRKKGVYLLVGVLLLEQPS